MFRANHAQGDRRREREARRQQRNEGRQGAAAEHPQPGVQIRDLALREVVRQPVEDPLRRPADERHVGHRRAAVADHHVRRARQLEHARQLLGRIGAVGVDDGDILRGALGDAALERGAVAVVLRAVDDAHAAVLRRLERAVRRAVVDDDDLEARAEVAEHAADGLDRVLDRTFLVVGGDHDAQLDLLGHRRIRAAGAGGGRHLFEGDRFHLFAHLACTARGRACCRVVGRARSRRARPQPAWAPTRADRRPPAEAAPCIALTPSRRGPGRRPWTRSGTRRRRPRCKGSRADDRAGRAARSRRRDAAGRTRTAAS